MTHQNSFNMLWKMYSSCWVSCKTNSQLKNTKHDSPNTNFIYKAVNNHDSYCRLVNASGSHSACICDLIYVRMCTHMCTWETNWKRQNHIIVFLCQQWVFLETIWLPSSPIQVSLACVSNSALQFTAIKSLTIQLAVSHEATLIA